MYKLWMNGLIYSLNDENTTYSAMLTFNDKIITLGYEKELIENIDSPVEIINLKNNCVIPSFIDSHIHLIGHGDMLTKVDFSIYKEKRAVLNKIKEIAKENDVVLLSPASASWDQYKECEVRGDEFRDLVNKL